MIFSIDQNSNPLWDPIPKLQALQGSGRKPVHYVEDADIAFTRRGSLRDGSGLDLMCERYYRGGVSDWGAALFYFRFLGRNPVDLREIEPYTGWTTAALSRRLDCSVDELYDRYSDSDNIQLVGPSFFNDDPHFHRTIGDLQVSEIAPYLCRMMDLAETDMLDRFPEKGPRARIHDWFGNEKTILDSLVNRHTGNRIPDLYRDWMKHHLPETEIDLVSNLFASGPVAENGHQLLDIFLRDYPAAAELYNRALEISGSPLNPLCIAKGELPFFLLQSRNGHLVRSDLNFENGHLCSGERSWPVEPGIDKMLERMRSVGVVAIVGKALLLVIQVRMKPNGQPLALPHKGSIYMHTAFELERQLADNGLIPGCHPVFRVNFHFTRFLGTLPVTLRLPQYLVPVFGKELITAKEFASALPALMDERKRELENLRDPDFRERFCRRKASGELERRDELIKERRRCSELPELRDRLPELNAEIRHIERNSLEQLLERTLENFHVLNLDYWSGRGALFPWAMAAGGMDFYQDLLKNAEIRPEP